MLRWSLVGLLVFCATPAWAAPRCAPARSARREAHRSVAVVPFAVPVAVPVAVVQQPSVWYRAALPQAAVAADGSTALDSPPPNAEAGTDPAESLRLAAEELLRSKCAQCHSQTAARGGLAMFDEAGVLRPKLPRGAMLEAVSPAEDGRARMPPGDRTPLDEAELELLRKWAQPPRDLEY